MAQPLPSRGEIVGCLMEAGKALHARQIAERCGVPDAAYSRLLELLDQLHFDGSIRRVGGQRFRAQAAAERGTPLLEGVLSVNPRGFGFVTAAGQDDVYVAPDGIGAAMHGDRVKVAVVARTSRGVEGRIEIIVARRNARVAGVLRRRGKSCWLEPDDTRMRGPIVLSNDGVEGKEGDAAVARITRFPESAAENPEGELVAVLGTPGDPNTEVAKILVREQIVEAHPEAAVREAEAMAARIQRRTFEGRVDLRNVPLPTIDPEDARDHDDAIWVERVDEGYRAYIAIAYVSEYVQVGSALDQEAMTRGTTIYLPDRAIPMLPAALAADLCSLLPERERLCLCVIAELDKHGTVKNYEIVEGVMRSCAMLTYGGVARALGFTEDVPKSAQAEAMKTKLRVLDELARKLRRIRMRRGALDLDLPEARVLLDEQTGAPRDIVKRAEDPGVKRAYQIVEELMLLANELVAKWLSKRRCPTVYRVHGKPDETKLERLGEVARALGVEFELADMLAPAGVGKWLASIHDHPRRQVLEMLLLRSLKQAVYDIVNIGHFGLASDNYLHFTSPIRRYPDILVHRAVKSLLHGGKPDVTPAGIEALRASATNASVRERAAMDVEREVVDLYRALYMRDHVGEVYDGTVTTVVGSGLYTTLDHPFIDVLVRYEGLGPDRYEASEDELSVVGVRSGDTVSLGDKIVVTIDDVAVLRRTVYARRVPPDSAGRARKPQVQRAKAAKLGKGARKNQRPARSSGTAERARPRGRTERSQHQGRKRKRS